MAPHARRRRRRDRETHPMTLPLENRTVALAEGRQLEELAQLLVKEGARPLRCPMVSMLDPPDDAPALAWLDRLSAGAFAWVVLLTGEGVRRLLDCAARHDRHEAVVAALGRTRLLTRGPKPGQALKDVGLAPTLVAPVATTDGIIQALKGLDLHGATVGVQLYSESNPPLMEYLRQTGATVETVQPYVYAPAADAERVVDLIGRLAAGSVDALVFTSSPQIDRLFDVAKERGLTESLHEGLKRACVAAVGPVVRDNLERRGVTVGVCPEQGFVMKNLVQLLKRHLAPNT